jgi:hypothetical protein
VSAKAGLLALSAIGPAATTDPFCTNAFQISLLISPVATAACLIIQVVTFVGSDIEEVSDRKQLIKYLARWQVNNIGFCFVVLFVELMFCAFMTDYFFSAVRELSPECRRNDPELVWQPPSRGFLWQMGHGVWFNLHHEGPLGPTEEMNLGYEYPHSSPMSPRSVVVPK